MATVQCDILLISLETSVYYSSLFFFPVFSSETGAMSERARDRLLLSGTRDLDSISPYQRYEQLRQRAGAVVTHYWAKTIAILRGREFFAEFLATFVLIVRYCSSYVTFVMTCM